MALLTLIVLLAVAAALPRRFHHGRWITLAAVVLLTALSLPVTARALVGILEAGYRPFDRRAFESRPSTARLVIILGGGQDVGAIEYADGERMKDATLARAYYGGKLAQSLGLPVAVTGGNPDGAKRSEAKMMRDFLAADLRQPVQFMEERSSNTRQNALFSAEELKKLGIREVILVTDAAHMPRAARAFEKAGLIVIPAPMRYHSYAPFRGQDLVPSSAAFDRSNAAIREVVANLVYRLRE